jgi:uncharacterized delta-60 repeat protein
MFLSRNMSGNSQRSFARKAVSRSRLSIITLLAVLALAVWATLIAQAAAGDLDRSFSVDGKVNTDFFGSFDEATDIIEQPDGKILAIGYTNARTGGADFGLARYNTNGSPDKTFSVDGRTNTDFGAHEFGMGVALQSDGKIVVVGVQVPIGSQISDFAVARYNPDGTLDTTFSNDGKVTTDFFHERDQGAAVAIQTDGKIVVVGLAGRNTQNGRTSDFGVVRYNTDGTLDRTFSGDGRQTTDFFGFPDFAEDVSIQTDGKILVGGTSARTVTGSDFAMARYNPDGSRDASFSGDGKLNTDFDRHGDVGEALAILPDQRIVLSGFTFDGQYHVAAARYNPDGTLDPTFSEDGKQTTSFADRNIAGFDMGVDVDGKVVVTGSTQEQVSDVVIVRYNADGSPDTTFSGDGLVIANFGADEFTSGGALQSDGRILVAGTFGRGPTERRSYNFLVARFQSADVTTQAPAVNNGNDELPNVNPEATKPVFRQRMQGLLPEEAPVLGSQQ